RFCTNNWIGSHRHTALIRTEPERLAGDTAYGSGANLNWLVNEAKIAPTWFGRRPWKHVSAVHDHLAPIARRLPQLAPDIPSGAVREPRAPARRVGFPG